MLIKVDRSFVAPVLARHPELAGWQEQLRFADAIEVDLLQLGTGPFDTLLALLRDSGPSFHAQATHWATLRTGLADSAQRFAGPDLEAFLAATLRRLLSTAGRGWLFALSVTGKPSPFVITRLDFTPGSLDEAGRVLIELKANAKGALQTTTIRIGESDIADRSLDAVFAQKGYLLETPELLARYDETIALYFAWRPHYGTQFCGRGTGFFADDPSATHRDTDWTRKDVVVLSSDGRDARLVNDEGMLSGRSLTLEAPGSPLSAYLRKAEKSNQFDGEEAVKALAAQIPGGMFSRIPVLPYLLMFHLDLHHHVWVHVDELRLYVYQPDLRDKLVLPMEQTDLIDLLTAEMDVLTDDIVAGKSGGTTVLCAGPPGVGKTLTAEVYAEIIGRPLYRVHSGQLGLSVTAMETALREVLLRAQRWGAVMLIDEADVYIRRRQDDLTSNAVVGIFLRVLEYFNGLLFLTTNRIDDIDEAILSRCIALIQYRPPDRAARLRLWTVMAQQFGLPLEPPLIEQLAETFPDATGRDIKGLAKLVQKFCRHRGVAPDLDIFRRCSTFRGLCAIPAQTSLGRPERTAS